MEGRKEALPLRTQQLKEGISRRQKIENQNDKLHLTPQAYKRINCF